MAAQCRPCFNSGCRGLRKAPYPSPPSFFAPKPSLGCYGANLNIWRQSLLPFSSYERTYKHTYTLPYIIYTGLPKKTSGTLRNYNGAYTLWGEISFGTFVDRYVLLLTYKFQ